jgi:hypothetical protein
MDPRKFVAMGTLSLLLATGLVLVTPAPADAFIH